MTSIQLFYKDSLGVLKNSTMTLSLTTLNKMALGLNVIKLFTSLIYDFL